MLRGKVFAILIGIAAALAAAPTEPRTCVPVAGDRIRGTDLIAAGLAAEPNLDLGPSPLPGLVRTLRADQPFGGTCFELQTTPVTAAAIEAAMRKALGGREARIEIVEFSQVSTPQSTLEFTLTSFSYPSTSSPDGAVIWRGRAVAGNRHSQPVWARVKVMVETSFLAATRAIPAGVILSESDIERQAAWSFPTAQAPVSNPADVIGLASLRTIAAGARIDRKVLTAPNMVETGQSIDIRVIAGGAQLHGNAVAERSGKLGEIVLARNEQSGKRFRARITGPAQAVVVVPERN